MALRDTLRKAAGLLVELPPEEHTAASPTSAAELDKLLAELEEKPTAPGPAPAKTVDQIVREADGPNLDETSARFISTPGSPPRPSPPSKCWRC